MEIPEYVADMRSMLAMIRRYLRHQPLTWGALAYLLRWEYEDRQRCPPGWRCRAPWPGGGLARGARCIPAPLAAAAKLKADHARAERKVRRGLRLAADIELPTDARVKVARIVAKDNRNPSVERSLRRRLAEAREYEFVHPAWSTGRRELPEPRQRAR